jgi:hypothetical protein
MILEFVVRNGAVLGVDDAPFELMIVELFPDG